MKTSSGPPGFDLSVLEQLAGCDAARFRKYALLFITSIEDVLSQVDDAVSRGDLEALCAMGHRAKSTARNIGAAGLADQCLRLEQLAAARERDAALATARELRPLYTVVRAALELRLAGVADPARPPDAQ